MTRNSGILADETLSSFVAVATSPRSVRAMALLGVVEVPEVLMGHGAVQKLFAWTVTVGVVATVCGMRRLPGAFHSAFETPQAERDTLALRLETTRVMIGAGMAALPVMQLVSGH